MVLASANEIRKAALKMEPAHRLSDRLAVLEDSHESLRMLVKRLNARAGMREAREAKHEKVEERANGEPDWRAKPEQWLTWAQERINGRMRGRGET
jgi:hypothetical protein